MQEKQNIANEIYMSFCDVLQQYYSDYVTRYNLNINAPVDIEFIDKQYICNDKNNYYNQNSIQINTINNTQIMRIDINNKLFTLRVKSLYDEMTKESTINIIDFRIKRLWLRCGGFGSNVISSIINSNDIWLRKLNMDNQKTRIMVFKFMSMPFWIRNGFEFYPFKSINNSWEEMYEAFKLLILLDKLNGIDREDPRLNSYFVDQKETSNIISKWVIKFYRDIYEESSQVKETILERIATTCCNDYHQPTLDFCTTTIYKNVCNKFANDRLAQKRIINLMQELFYLEKIVDY